MTKREKLAARARALAAMTMENGCTEAEAISAAGKLADMLSAHDMTMDEAELRENPFAMHEGAAEDDAVGERLWKPASSIAELTGTRYWRSPAGVRPVTVTFFGFDHEVEIAKYLLAICARAMLDGRERASRSYGLLNPARRRMRVTAYLDGMADSLQRRILALKPPRPEGTGLVVLRTELIDAALAEQGIKFNQMNSRRSRSLDADYRRGVAAAERVSLYRGVNADAVVKLTLG